MTAVHAPPQADRRHPAVATTTRESIGDLLVAAGSGDQLAFTRLHELCGARVLAVARSVTRDASLAQDIVQEVFLEIWRKGTRFDPALGAAVSWILSLARSRAIDRVRQTEAFRRRDSWYAARHLDRNTDTVTESVLHNLDVLQVANMLATLSPLHLEAIRLVYFAGHTHLQASAILVSPCLPSKPA